MSQRRALQILVLAGSLAAAGCGGSSNGTLDASGPPNEANVQAAVQEVVLPTLQQLGVYSPAKQQPSVPQPAPASGAPTPAGCFDLSGLCDSGSFEWCANDSQGNINWSWNYDDCTHPNENTQDGTWSLKISSSLRSASFALSVGDLGLAGDVSYTKDGSCWTHALDGFVSSGPRYTVGIDGHARYCPGTRPVGEFVLDVTGEKTFHATFDFDESVGHLVVVDNEGTVHDCTIDMVTGETDCEGE